MFEKKSIPKIRAAELSPPSVLMNIVHIGAISCAKVITRAAEILEIIRRILILEISFAGCLFCSHVVAVSGFEPNLRQSKCRVLKPLHYTALYSVCSFRRSFGWSSPGRSLVDPFTLFLS